jgi:hypothetical protein
MDLKPFLLLKAPRAVNRPELPPDLAEFYAEHEGIGLESSKDDYPVRLCRLDQVARFAWKDLRIAYARPDAPEGWEGFAAYLLGVGMFGDEILYVLDAPCCPPGSVLAIGRDMGGPGGVGPFSLEPSLVLAESFPAWLAHLERWGWVEYVVAGGDAPPDPQEVERYYLGLNPGVKMGGPDECSSRS